MSGDVVGSVGSKKDGRALQIVVIAESPQWDFLQEIFLVSFYHDLRHVRGKPARSNRVYLNVVNAPLAGQIFGKSYHATLAGVIADSLKFRGSAVNARDGGYVDDFPAALRGHEFSGSLRKQKSARQVRLDHFVPMFETHFFDRRAPGCACIVDENIDAAELRHGRIDNSLNLGRIFHVATEGQGLHSEALQFGGGPFAALLFAGAQDEISAHFRQAFRHLPAQADGAAGDNRHASSEIKELSNIHRRLRAFPLYLTCCGDSSVACRKHKDSRIGKY